MKRKMRMVMGMAVFLMIALCLQGCGKKAEDAVNQESEEMVEQSGSMEESLSMKEKLSTEEKLSMEESLSAEKKPSAEQPESGSAGKDAEQSTIAKQDAEKQGGSGTNTKKQDVKKQETQVKTTQTGGTQTATPATAGALRVEGTQLTDANGNAVQLKGISTHGMAWYPDYINEDCFRQFRQEWDANVVRLAMYTAENGGYCSGGDKNYLKGLVKSGVEYATAQDLYVIIDWHILSDGNPNTYIGEAKDFFTEMAQEYADYNNVIYEICNEPNGGTSWETVKSYAEEVIGIIRSYDDDAVIIVGTPNWCQFVDQAAADPITGYDNIMYALHFYAATHKESLRNTMTVAIDAGLPVFVSEYGICDASGNGGIDEWQANQWVDTMNAYGVSYVAWNLSNKNETSAILNSNCSKTSGFTDNDLSASGKWLYQMLTGDAVMGNSNEVRQQENSGNNNAGQQQENSSGGNTSNNAQQGGSSQPAVSLSNGDLACTAEVKNSWDSNGQTCYQYELTIQNASSTDCGSWSIDLNFNEALSFQDGWNGEYSASGSTLHITNKDYNGGIPAGGSIKDIGFIVCGSGNLTVTQ
ncbi:MAG: cellulase family glycosylhydrolase [Lachnoclostridium sp.]|nr:cellulase family glycosylhydrolase [Lachnospira sp.]MCM1247382.1 cellulase family glycosylhydrolase [Lachnoclostridium sp.]MCM1535525.1 cellulase family glycosylhydrolase [Clostridium sp.]